MTAVLLLVWALMGVVGVVIAQAKKVNAFAGFVLGALFGPLGWLLLAVSSPSEGQSKPLAVAIVVAVGAIAIVGTFLLVAS